MCRHDRLEVANSAGFVASLSKPATVPGTSERPRAAWQIRVPNITGELPSVRSYGSGTGAFYQGETATSVYQPAPYDWYREGQQSRFSAAKSDSTYKASSTVQPASVRLLACIKI